MNFLEHFGKALIELRHTRIISIITVIFAFVYHLVFLFVFKALGVMPMFYFNFISITVFLCLLLVESRLKSFLVPYIIAFAEVVAHQILADLGRAGLVHDVGDILVAEVGQGGHDGVGCGLAQSAQGVVLDGISQFFQLLRGMLLEPGKMFLVIGHRPAAAVRQFFKKEIKLFFIGNAPVLR